MISIIFLCHVIPWRPLIIGGSGPSYLTSTTAKLHPPKRQSWITFFLWYWCSWSQGANRLWSASLVCSSSCCHFGRRRTASTKECGPSASRLSSPCQLSSSSSVRLVSSVNARTTPATGWHRSSVTLVLVLIQAASKVQKKLFQDSRHVALAWHRSSVTLICGQWSLHSCFTSSDGGCLQAWITRAGTHHDHRSAKLYQTKRWVSIQTLTPVRPVWHGSAGRKC